MSESIKIKYIAPLRGARGQSEDGLPYLGLENIESGTGKIIESETPIVSDGVTSYYQKDDVLFGKLRPYLAKVVLAKSEGVCTGELLVLNSKKEKVNPAFLAYRLRADDFIKAVNNSTYGSKMPRANWTFIGNQKIELPALADQEKVVQKLDSNSTIITRLIEDKKRLIQKLNEQRAFIIHQAITRGLNNDVELINSNTAWIEKIPKDFFIRSLKQVVKTKITDGPHSTPEILDSGIPFLSAQSIQGNNTIDFAEKRGFISREDHEEFCKKCKPQRGDIFMVKSGATTGRIGLVETDEEFSIWSPLALIRANRDVVLPEYLYFFLQTKLFQDQVKLSWSYGTQQNIGMGVIENLKIILPQINEQKRIVDYLNEKTKLFNSVIGSIDKSINLLTEYSQSLNVMTVLG